MFGIGTTEILLILVVALLVIGPTKLPEVARALGKGMAEFRRMSSDVKRTIDLEGQLSDMENESSEEDGRTGTQSVDEVPKAKERDSGKSKTDHDQDVGDEDRHQEDEARTSRQGPDEVDSRERPGNKKSEEG